ncbi:MAG: YegP family protein [Lewinellaceae bacterium]|nr:YegP family protein [Lewinellaceae bacterium]
MKFEIFLSDGNQKFYFRLKASNGQVILSSQGYASKASAKQGIASVIKNAQARSSFVTKVSNDNKPYFSLLAGNKQVIGNSQMYSSEASMENGIQSVMTTAAQAEIIDLTLA